MTPRDLAVPGPRLQRNTRHRIVLGLLLIGLASLAAPASSAADTGPTPDTGKDVYFKTDGPISGPPAPRLTTRDYPQIPLPWPLSESRIVMWVLAQQHLYFAAFVLGALFWIMGLELWGLLARRPEVAQRCDRAAQDVLGLVILAVSGVAITGALLLLAFLSLYPDFAKYLFGLFRPFVWLYGLLFVAFSLTIYVYYYLWRRMTAGLSKWLHATLGVLVNVIGNVIMMIGSSWGSFMMSPAGVDERGRFLGNYAHVLNNALWNPFTVHRFENHLIFGAVVIAAYAGYQALREKNADQRGFYSWMSRTALLGMVVVLFTVPFGGYALKLHLYAFRQQMGITLSGGLLAWLFIILVILMTLVFLAANYYLWRRIGSSPGCLAYRPHAKWIFLILGLCALVYVTPHTLVMRAAELKAIGGQQHPVVGNYGVMSAKQVAMNFMILATMWSLIIYWRSGYQLRAGRSALDAALIGLLAVGGANIIWTGIIGYYIPANVRVGLSIPMAITTLHVVIVGALLTFARIRRAQPTRQPAWGPLSWQDYLPVLAMAATVTWLEGLGGYVRSSVRLFWHATEIFRDNSPWAFTHTIGLAANVITFNALLFWGILLALVWLKQESRVVKKRDARRAQRSRATDTPLSAAT